MTFTQQDTSGRPAGRFGALQPPSPSGARRPGSPQSASFQSGSCGARLLADDGRRLIDFCCGFGDVLLGHADAHVETAVAAQWSGGAPRAHLEAAAADRLMARLPFAEQVVFAADARDALAVAVSSARRETGRRTVLVCGAPPAAVSDGGPTALGPGSAERFGAVLTGAIAAGGRAERVAHDDPAALSQALDRHAGEVAAILCEPMARGAPAPGRLQQMRRLADRHGAVLIFDEAQSGLRVDARGVQGLFGVCADISVFGPGLANGYPLAAMAGRRALTRTREAFAPAPAASLAAACATMDKIDREPVLNTVQISGAEIQAEVERLLAATGAAAFTSICGDPTHSVLAFRAYKGVQGGAFEQRLRAQCLARGVFALGAHAASYAHGDDEICALLDVYAEVLPMLKDWADTREQEGFEPGCAVAA